MVSRQTEGFTRAGHYLVVCTLLLACTTSCTQTIQPLSLGDTRLPATAKQRIADAEDAVIIAHSRAEDAFLRLEEVKEKITSFETKPPQLDSAMASARQLNSTQLSLAELNLKYTTADVNLSKARLQLVYAQTSMRYDLAVYDLEPLEKAVEQQRARLLKLRKERKAVDQELRSRLDEWWSAYQTLSGGKGTQAYWSHELSAR